MVLALPRKPPYTVDDLDDFPSDGNRYELIDGDLHVSAAPAHLHQRVVLNIGTGLKIVAPPTFEVIVAPLDLVLNQTTVVEPDVLVIPAGEPRGERIEERPVLVVEVLSPSNRSYDLRVKRPVYRDADVPALWIVDPDEPSITAFRWEGHGEVVTRAVGDDTLSMTYPFDLSIVPAELNLGDGWRSITSG